MEQVIEEMEQEAYQLENTCQEFIAKNKTQKEDDKKMGVQIEALKNKNKVYENQLRDVKEIKTQLGDQKNKEIKGIE